MRRTGVSERAAPGEELERRRKRLHFRSRRRGTRESDLILGRFADAHLAEMSAGQLDRYAALLEASDPDIYAWLVGREPVPASHDNDVMTLLKRFKVHLSSVENE